MKSAHLHLDLGGTWLQARLMQPRGWFGHQADCLFATQGPVGDGTRLDDALQALAQEISRAGVRMKGAHLRVAVGLPHVCVGLMKLTQGDGRRLSASALQSYVAAWIEHSVHRDPAAQVVRWQVLRNPQHVLVSCVERSTFESLASFAGAHALKFDSCLPAVMHAVRSAGRDRTRLLAWTEGIGALRDPVLQLLRFEDGQLQAAWRGWASVSEGDPQLAGSLGRFSASQGLANDTQVAHVRWPDATAGEAMGA